MSDWNSWLLIIAVVALAVGPVMMFKPSGGQRKLAKLRGIANRAGLRVRLASGNNKALAGTALYAMPWVHKPLRSLQWALVRKDYVHEIHLNDVWSWENSTQVPDAVKALLAEEIPALPVSVMGVSAGAEGLGVNWSERGSEVELQAIMAWLTEMQNKLNDKLAA
ncbi:hypothetical protein L1F30_07545 [Simiduia sp. 21SJ11W-1]|uniref:hypothetical protein n=1 Tax=Simiduia sp. 21SJ11W-1 TaxID=2909669 RepID=UPI00209E585F|nr:hypothetical protein [Simiduia sp. 21SJ11W-1]UTA49380.1 hypothetical protein L1F30_07545 [Simiduia sp. 21SJ11W-1]